MGRDQGLPEIVARAAIAFGGRNLWPRAASDRRLVPMLEGAVTALGDTDSALRVRVYARLATAVRGDAPTERRDRAIAESVATARRLGEPALLGYALEARSLTRWWPGHIDDARADTLEVARLGREAGDAEREFGGHENGFYTAWALGDVAAGREHLARARELADALRQPAQQWVVSALDVIVAVHEGRLDDAEEGSVRTYAIGARTLPWNARAMQRLQTYVLLRLRDRLPEYEATARSSVEEYDDYPIFETVLTDVLARLGHHDEARDLLARLAVDRFDAIGHDEMRFAGIALLGEAAAAVGDVERAAAIYDELRSSAGLVVVSPVELSLDSASRVLGRLAAALGRTDDARAHFDAAIEHNERIGAVPWIEVARVDRAAALG